MAKSDDDAMAEAKARLERRGVPYKCPSSHQIKIGDVNFYPSTGTIFIDGERAKRRETGLSALERLLKKRALIR
jgi:hypothetical protein